MDLLNNKLFTAFLNCIISKNLTAQRFLLGGFINIHLHQSAHLQCSKYQKGFCHINIDNTARLLAIPVSKKNARMAFT